MRRPALAAACLLSFAVVLPAQARAELVFRLPPAGAAEYTRELQVAFGTARDLAATRALAPAGEVPERYLPRLVPAPWLCQGELGAEQRALEQPPADLRDVLRTVAFDLRLQGAVRLRLPRLLPYGDLLLTGRAEPFAADGSQELVLQVASEAIAPLPGESKAMFTVCKPLSTESATGELRLQRSFDPAQGVLTGFDGRLQLLGKGAQGCHQLLVRDRWTFVAVHDNQDAAFRSAVGTAIQKGAAWVHRELKQLDSKPLTDRGDPGESYGAGRLALLLLTALKCEIPATDPLVAGGLAALRARELIDTYSLGVALMAMEAAYAPKGEREQLLSGVLAAPRPRQLSDADRAVATAWLQRLLTNLDSRRDRNAQLAFNYTRAPRFDNSVQQYGELGLWSAHLCGLPVPGTLWRAAGNHLLQVQCAEEERPVALQLQSYGEPDAGKARTQGGGKVLPRGFAYQGPDQPAYGSMTTAGLAGLQLARAGLLANDLGRAELLAPLEAAQRAGYAWLVDGFTVRSNPGFRAHAARSWYYYLYGLERVCELGGIARLGGRDWYYEGALQLLAQQQRNGSFRSERSGDFLLDGTCFALLFLKKATLPAVTGR